MRGGDAEHAQHEEEKDVDYEPVFNKEFTWWCCFRDNALEARFCRHRLLAGASARRLTPIVFSLVAVLKLSTAVVVFREEWDALEVGICLFGIVCVLVACALSTEAFRSLHPDTQSRVMTAWLATLAAYHPVHLDFRMATMSGGQGRHELAATSECEIVNVSLSMRSCAWLAVLLVQQELNVSSYFCITGVCLFSKVFWALRVPLPGERNDFVSTVAFHVTCIILILMAKAHMNMMARASFLSRLRLREHHKRVVDKVLKASMAEAAQRERSRLIRVVMHDLRSPLLAASNVKDALAALPPGTSMADPTLQQLLEVLNHCVPLTQNILDDMLCSEQIDSGKLVLVPRDFQLRELLRASECTFVAMAQQRGVHLHVEMPTGELNELVLTADMRRLQQVLNNGLSNALKFTDSGGTIRVRARLGSHEQAGWVRVHLTVADTGIGLSADELRVLSEGIAFAQVGRGQMQGNGGTGLGLSICRTLLELHTGSELKLRSAGPGKGTEFEVCLVCPGRFVPAECTPASGPAAPVVPRALTPQPCSAGFRVLYAEDDKVLRLTMKLRLFNKLGVQADYVDNGTDALVMAAAHEYSLIILDNQV